MRWSEKLPMLPGIYKLTNLINGKIYIGESNNVFGRISKYTQETCTRTINFAIKKYGWNNFRKEIIEAFPIGTTKQILRTRETFWIKFLNSHVLKNGYNEVEDTIDPRGVKIQQKRKFKAQNGLIDKSQARSKGVCKPPCFNVNSTVNFKSQPVYQLDLKTGEILKEWPSVRAAAAGLSGGTGGSKAINGVIKGEYGRKSYYGFGWKYVFPETNGFDPNASRTLNTEIRERISKNRKGKYLGENNHMYGKHHTEERKEKISKTKTGVPNPLKQIKVNQIDPKTKKIIKTWNSVSEASKGTGAHTSVISGCLHKKYGRKTAGGFYWELAESVTK
ncbi:MAG: hypothetical protein FMNOHCHN_03932 [Ignavibacteriaceae bacterium]|nr:hypothetical protein [Ignavibacteriaceae bacterium]